VFDLTLPADDRNGYGIRLTDRTASQAGDSTVELRVGRGADGIERVQLREIDFGSHTTTVLQSFTLNPGSNNQILLSLSYDVTQPGVVQASFALKNGELTTVTNFSATGTIFNNENWTRAQFFAEAPQQSDSVLQGTYGQLDITQAGAWTYQLANGQANVQALRAGQTATDSFTVQVADGHGGTDTKTIMVTVTGTNDQTVLTSVNSTAASTNVAESSGDSSAQNIAAIAGSLAFSDKDIGDSLTASAASPSVLINGNALTSELSAPAAAVLTAALDHLSLGAGVTSNGGGTQTISWTWDPTAANLDFLKAGDTLTVTYAVHVGDSATQNLTFTVTGTNDSPVAFADVAAITEDALPNTVNGNVLTNDTDVDIGDTHSVTAVTGGTDNGTTITVVGTYGTLVITKATGGYTYALADGQANVQALADGQHVTDVFTYTNSDNHGGSSQSTLTVTVTGVNDAPTIAAGTTATGHIVAAPQDAAAPLTALATSYLTAGHNLINGLGGSSGFGENDLADGDDNSSGAIDITSVFGAAGLNFFGHSYTSLYINNNGKYHLQLPHFAVHSLHNYGRHEQSNHCPVLGRCGYQGWIGDRDSGRQFDRSQPRPL
jgi:VCBS repeat-containing protein